MNLKELEKAAKSASKGDWKLRRSDDLKDLTIQSPHGTVASFYYHAGQVDPNAVFVAAAANPETILKLIAVAEAAKNLYCDQMIVGSRSVVLLKALEELEK